MNSPQNIRAKNEHRINKYVRPNTNTELTKYVRKHKRPFLFSNDATDVVRRTLLGIQMQHIFDP